MYLWYLIGRRASLGRGAYGVVYKVRHKTTGAVYAAKRVKNNPTNLHEVDVCVDSYELLLPVLLS